MRPPAVAARGMEERQVAGAIPQDGRRPADEVGQDELPFLAVPANRAGGRVNDLREDRKSVV